MNEDRSELGIDSSVSPSSASGNKKTSNNFIIAILLTSLLLVVAAGIFAYLNNSLIKKNIATSNVFSPSPFITSTPAIPSPPLDPDTTSILYSVTDKGFNQIAAFKDKTVVKNYSFVPVEYDGKNEALYSGSPKNIFVYDLKSKTQKDVYKVSDPNLVISSFQLADNNLYINLSSSIDESNGYIDELNLATQKLRRIGPQKNVMYGIIDYLFKTTQNDDVVASHGGDGCGGFGVVRLLESNKVKSEYETGGGCNEKPEVIANLASENKILLLSKIPGTYENPIQKYDALYTRNVYTSEEKVLVDFKSIPKNLTRIYFDKSLNKLYLIFLDEIWTLNIQNGQIDSKVAINKSINLNTESYFLFHNNKLYTYSEDPVSGNFNLVIKSADIVTGEIKQYNWGKAYPISGSASIIGFRQDEPLIMLYVY